MDTSKQPKPDNIRVGIECLDNERSAMSDQINDDADTDERLPASAALSIGEQRKALVTNQRVLLRHAQNITSDEI